ncbi:beta-1,3-galactosyltransferase brn [Cephus cinctus]|uniref:Beta-1,3-galactosyltransferase brn n=1 Tax=Cephus cinctus TaxID=211228 RepID=A0AAJ7C8Y5_CEPCN|nr:beta-1,3-galactosyltransferase brn [Cephus cinctus]XP_015604864.1 beta-1,3-galactosyltransferase brn [Cephus cinctus]XP_015604865.1 beta-1,3-galactosyltransferase brn [Cephus cinctus]XP_024945464.1 beta-1,3-galactosyltransferase brn [Cephus cinctus]XP_024945465.1 beta-1,3-galactosyltransferase brn [Cephus cinctus]
MYCLLRPCFQLSFRLATRIKLKHVCASVALIMVLDFFGAFTHLFEITYDEHFIYPFDGDVHNFVEQIRHNEKPDVSPINEYNYNYTFDVRNKCSGNEYQSLKIVFIVKSAIDHFDRRLAIRNSWGFEKRFFDVPTRTVFLLGVRPDDEELQSKVQIEAAKYKDIVQADFVDSYYNNTIKTMMGFKWVVNYCSTSKFYMFADDDVYVSVKNVLRFIRNPTYYPDYFRDTRKLGGHKREIKESDMLNISVPLHLTENNQNNTLTIYRGQRATVKEKILMRRKPGWTHHNKTKFPDEQEIKATMDSASTNVSESQTTHWASPKTKLEVFEKPNSTILSRNKRATAKEKIAMRRKPGWTNHEKTKFPSPTLQESERAFGVPVYTSKSMTSLSKRTKRQVFDLELPEDVRLFAGFVFVSSPHRHRSSKWYVSLKEYPYHLWPPYVTAGAYVLSKEALLDMYYTSLYTKHFRFDDIFLGLVAKKAEIEPFHCEEFHFYKKDYTKYNYKYVISSHGYGDPQELLDIWNEQKALGNA